MIVLDDDTRRSWDVVSDKGQNADLLRLPPGVHGRHRHRQQMDQRGRGRDDRTNRTASNVVAGADCVRDDQQFFKPYCRSFSLK